MTNNERMLVRCVCEGNIVKSQQAAKILLNEMSTKKDEQFKQNMLQKLKEKEQKFIELPVNVRDVLIAENTENFPEERFLLRTDEEKIVNKLLDVYAAAEKLSKLNIAYLPALMLYGPSGTGKTMLARYIAHKAEMPFVYVRFSALISSYLGGTQSKLAKIFEYVRTTPCVLCFDEIDAVGMARGQKQDVGEMNRIVISLMQELDTLPNNVIVVGTTNRFDRLDDALVRRFPLQQEVRKLSCADAEKLALKFFTSAGVNTEWFESWFSKLAPSGMSNAERCFSSDADLYFSAADIVKKCTEKIVELTIKETQAEKEVRHYE